MHSQGRATIVGGRTNEETRLQPRARQPTAIHARNGTEGAPRHAGCVRHCVRAVHPVPEAQLPAPARRDERLGNRAVPVGRPGGAGLGSVAPECFALAVAVATTVQPLRGPASKSPLTIAGPVVADVTASVTDAVCVSDPPVPVTVSGEVPVGALAAVAIVTARGQTPSRWRSVPPAARGHPPRSVAHQETPRAPRPRSSQGCARRRSTPR